MKLFTVGPVEMYPETLQVSGTQLPYFRNDEFSSIMKEEHCFCAAAEVQQWRRLLPAAFADRTRY